MHRIQQELRPQMWTVPEFLDEYFILQKFQSFFSEARAEGGFLREQGARAAPGAFKGAGTVHKHLLFIWFVQLSVDQKLTQG